MSPIAVTTADPVARAAADLGGRRVAVVGGGRTGASVVRFLRRAGASVVITDDRRDPPAAAELGGAGLEWALGGLDGAALMAADLVVVSPGVDPQVLALEQARDAGIPVVGDVELFGRYAGAPVVVVTGSNGKSTVTRLTGAIFEAAGWDAGVGGNLGTPALDLLTDPEPGVYVLEVSSFQAELLTDFRPRVAVLLNLSPDHLDRYTTPEAYFDAKMRLFAAMGAGDTAILAADDPAVMARARALPRDVDRRWFTAGVPEGETVGAGVAPMAGAPWLALNRRDGLEGVLPLGDWPLLGAPNRANAAAALVAADTMGVGAEGMAQALQGFRGLAHRMEPVAEVAGVTYVNDSKGTNIGAVAAALAGLEGPFIWIGGGRAKGGDFAALGPILAEGCREAVLIGEAAGSMAAAVAAVVPSHDAGTLGAAVRRAAAVARPGDTVVLSPGCASFDQYPGFEARGEDFRHAVAELEADRAAL